MFKGLRWRQIKKKGNYTTVDKYYDKYIWQSMEDGPSSQQRLPEKSKIRRRLEDAQESAIWKQKVGVEIKKLVIKAFQELRSVKAETWHSLMFKRQIQLGETGQLDMSHKWQEMRLKTGEGSDDGILFML